MKKQYTKQQIVEAIKFWQRKLDEVDDLHSINDIEVVSISDKDQIAKLLPEVIDLVNKTYEPIGGYYGTTDIERLVRTTSLVKIVKDTNGKLVACAYYRNMHNSFKLQAYGNDGTQYGKAAVKAIIKSDVAPYTNWVWGEVSRSVEKYFKKFEGYPLPNSLVAEVLKKNSNDIEMSKDGFHYKRKIGKNSEATEKVVYGFPSQDVADRAMASANYEIERHKLNMQLINEDEPSKRELSFDGACSFVDQLSDLYDDEGWRQLTPGLSAMLDQSIEVIKKNAEQEKWIQMTLDNALYLREHMDEISFVKNTL